LLDVPGQRLAVGSHGPADDGGDPAADRRDLVVVIDPAGGALDQDATQVEVLLAVLDQAGDARVTLQVERLL
jgi:hypothetical protein